jgi:hypothetical protein
MSRIIIGIAGIGLSVLTYNLGYSAASSKFTVETSDADYRSLLEHVSEEEIKLTDPVPRQYLENWAEGYYE